MDPEVCLVHLEHNCLLNFLIKIAEEDEAFFEMRVYQGGLFGLCCADGPKEKGRNWKTSHSAKVP